MPDPPRPNPPAHVARLTVEGASAGVVWANIFWIRNGGGQSPGVTDFQAFLADVGQSYNDHFSQNFYVGVTVADVAGIYYGPTGGDLGGEYALNTVGSKASNPMPNNAATCISWHVQQRYKGGHPRTYLPITDISSQQDARSWKTTYVSDVAAHANSFHSEINAMTHGQLTDLHLGTVSFVLRKEWRSPPVFRDFTLDAATVDTRIDSMRRRLGPDIL